MDNVDRELYIRQQPLDLATSQDVAIIGCGGIGSWVAFFLALAGIRRLDLHDSDEVSVHNLNRLPLTQKAIGKNKAVALADFIRGYRPNCIVYAHGNLDEEITHRHIAHAHTIVCSTDNLKSRQLAQRLAGGGEKRYLELGADGVHATVTAVTPQWSTELEEDEGYQSVPVFVGPCTLAASIAVYYVLHWKQPNKTFKVDFKQGDLVIKTIKEGRG